MIRLHMSFLSTVFSRSITHSLFLLAAHKRKKFSTTEQLIAQYEVYFESREKSFLKISIVWKSLYFTKKNYFTILPYEILSSTVILYIHNVNNLTVLKKKQKLSAFGKKHNFCFGCQAINIICFEVINYFTVIIFD